MPLMTKADYARLKGWSKSYLSKKTTRERIAPAMETDPEDGKLKINSEKADEIFRMTQDPARAKFRKDNAHSSAPVNGNAENVEIGSYEKNRTDLAAIKVEEATLDLLARKKETLDRKQVKDACTAAGQIIREYMNSAGRRIAEKAATMTDARAIKSMFDDEMRIALEAASNDFTRRIPEGTTDKDENINAFGGERIVN